MNDGIDWHARLDARGVGWYCGHVRPIHVPSGGGMTGDEIAALPRCDRWHPTRELRDACDHGATDPYAMVVLDEATDDHGSDPVVTVPTETTVRVNRWDGECLWCGGRVAAGAGHLVDIDGLLRPAHKDGDCG